MNNQITRLFIVFLFILFVSCKSSPTETEKSTYEELKSIELFTLTIDSISNSLAKALNINSISFNKIVSTDELTPKTGIHWIKEGYEYSTNNNAKITIWTDSSDKPYQIAYNLMRLGASEDWDYEQEKADSLIIALLKVFEIGLNKEVMFKSERFALATSHWYNIELYQKFKNEPLKYPFILAEVEGGVAQVNFLCIHRWYSNLADINQLVGDEELKFIAMDYFKSSNEVIKLPDSLEILDINIIDNKLCKRIGKAIIDKSGSSMNLYLDIQNGSIVYVERKYLR